jgi:hypothetical protein
MKALGKSCQFPNSKEEKIETQPKFFAILKQGPNKTKSK